MMPRTLLRRAVGAASIAMLAGMLSMPAQAQRISLSDLQQQIQALKDRLDTLSANPCPAGHAITAVNPDGTPVCARFVRDAVTFSFDFTGGTAGTNDAVTLACPAWQDFVAQALSKGAASGFAGEDNLTTPGTGAAAQKLEVGALARTINALQDNHHGDLYGVASAAGGPPIRRW